MEKPPMVFIKEPGVQNGDIEIILWPKVMGLDRIAWKINVDEWKKRSKDQALRTPSIERLREEEKLAAGIETETLAR